MSPYQQAFQQAASPPMVCVLDDLLLQGTPQFYLHPLDYPNTCLPTAISDDPNPNLNPNPNPNASRTTSFKGRAGRKTRDVVVDAPGSTDDERDSGSRDDNDGKRPARGDAGRGGDGCVYVRARRGQATDSHSLAERVRRQKISERMKLLQSLVPGCDQIGGKALILDQVINYVHSLQTQVQFLKAKLAAVDPTFNVDEITLDSTDTMDTERWYASVRLEDSDIPCPVHTLFLQQSDNYASEASDASTSWFRMLQAWEGIQ